MTQMCTVSPATDAPPLSLSDARTLAQAEWSLSTYLSLPWTPLISILGSTDYVVDVTGSGPPRIVSHVESWSVSGLQALGQMLRPATVPLDEKTAAQAAQQQRGKGSRSLASRH